jgi:hypothetical protein
MDGLAIGNAELVRSLGAIIEQFGVTIIVLGVLYAGINSLLAGENTWIESPLQ